MAVTDIDFEGTGNNGTGGQAGEGGEAGQDGYSVQNPTALLGD